MIGFLMLLRARAYFYIVLQEATSTSIFLSYFMRSKNNFIFDIGREQAMTKFNHHKMQGTIARVWG
jgi:hypothetical protein